MMSNVRKVLEFLASRKRDEAGDAWTLNKDIQEGTKLSPAEVNDSIELAENRGLIEVLKAMGTAPFKFHSATITAEGRLWLESKK